MIDLLSHINWVEKDPVLDALLARNSAFTLLPMTQGNEGEVSKLCSGETCFILKVWNKSSKPNIAFQYQLLSGLYEQGLSVSKPLGWGKTDSEQKDSVLLTYDDGGELQNYSHEKMKEIAVILDQIHRLDADKLLPLGIPKHDFFSYFYSGIEQYPDLQEVVTDLLSSTSIKQDNLIHGDFHLNNLVEKDGRVTVIDWTNAQLGDVRYDFAWSYFLKRIYMPSFLAESFAEAYLSLCPIQEEDQYKFEAFACMRWTLLYRNAFTPEGPNLIDRVKEIAGINPFLKEAARGTTW